MELDIWSSDFGLPSIDTNCLQVLVRVPDYKVPSLISFIAGLLPFFGRAGKSDCQQQSLVLV